MLSEDQIRRFRDDGDTVVRGKPARWVRLVTDSIELPQAYRDGWFFGLQGQASAENR